MKQAGCGCALPTSGVVLTAVTAILAWAVARTTDGWTPMWLAVIGLVVAITILFARVTWSGR